MSLKTLRAIAQARHDLPPEMFEHIERVAARFSGDENAALVALLHHTPRETVERLDLEDLYNARVASAVWRVTARPEFTERRYWYEMGLLEDTYARQVAEACLFDERANLPETDYAGRQAIDELHELYLNGVAERNR